jgi:hypothetical protein
MQRDDNRYMNIIKKIQDLASIITTKDSEFMLQEQEVITIDDSGSFNSRARRALHKMGNNRWRPNVDVPFRDIHNSDFPSTNCTHPVCKS